MGHELGELALALTLVVLVSVPAMSQFAHLFPPRIWWPMWSTAVEHHGVLPFMNVVQVVKVMFLKTNGNTHADVVFVEGFVALQSLLISALWHFPHSAGYSAAT
jgi:hypothetical protein